MKIGLLFLTNQPGKGGLEQVVKTITHCLSNEHNKFYIYGIHKPTDQSFLQYASQTRFIESPLWVENKRAYIPKFIHRFITRKYREKSLKNLLRKAQEDELDILIVLNLYKQFSQNYQALRAFKKATHIPIVSWPHGTLLTTPKKIRRKLKKQISLFDGHLAISSGIKKELEELYEIKTPYLIYNPIPEPDKIIPRQNNRFIFIGRIDENKRLLGILNQLKKLQGDWHLDIFGSAGSIEQDNDLLAFISNLNLCTKITFHGWTTNPWAHIPAAGVLLLNSKQEGLPLVIAEALARGIPVLSSNCPVGPNELIKHSKNGWLYEVDDEDSIYQILQAVLNREISLPAENACRDSVRHLNAYKVSNNFIAALKDILQKTKTY